MLWHGSDGLDGTVGLSRPAQLVAAVASPPPGPPPSSGGADSRCVSEPPEILNATPMHRKTKRLIHEQRFMQRGLHSFVVQSRARSDATQPRLTESAPRSARIPAT